MKKKIIILLIISVSCSLLSCKSFVNISGEIENTNFQDKILLHGDIKKFEDGSLRYEHGVPVLRVSGSYYDMGLQYGVLLKDELGKAFKDFENIYNKLIDSLPLYKRGLFISGFINPIIKKTKNRLPQKYKDEIKGLSEGSGIPEKYLYLSAGGGGFLEFACSVIIQRDENRILHGRILDWYPAMGKSTVIVEYTPEHAKKYTTIGLLHYPTLGISGLGENGISTSINLISYIKNKKNNRNLPLYYMTREILESADNINDVDKMLTGFKADIGWLLGVTDGHNADGAIFEIGTDDINKIDLEKSTDCIWGINGFKDNEMNKKYTSIFDKKAVINDPRRQRWTESVELENLGVDYLINILSDTSFEGYSQYYSEVSRGPINSSKNIQSIVFDNVNGVFYFAYGEGFAGLENFYKYDTKTSEMTLYREKIERPEKLENFRKLNENALIDIIAGDYQSILDKIDLDSELFPVEVEMLYNIWKDDNESIAPTLLLEQLDNQIKRYPDVCANYYMKAKILYKTSCNSDKLLITIEKALVCRIVPASRKIEMYKMLSEYYKNNGKDEKYEYYTQLCNDFIKSLNTNYKDNYK
ncbi:MAG: C45 family autoproteolytic acyltransferase/hydrolase [Spirochaetales bacterium]|nr:C45 family autoproteolytic acyltransferase/hydrolase [Spirochaetales bacterium]